MGLGFQKGFAALALLAEDLGALALTAGFRFGFAVGFDLGLVFGAIDQPTHLLRNGPLISEGPDNVKSA